MADGIKCQQKFMPGFVIFSGCIMTGFLPDPFPESLFGFRTGKGFRVNYDPGIGRMSLLY